MASMAEHKFDNTANGGGLSNAGMSGQSQGNWVLNFGGGSAQATSGAVPQKTLLMWAALAAGAWWLVKNKKI